MTAERKSNSHKFNIEQILDALTDYFNIGEIETLCFNLRIDYESLPAMGKDDKARELILACKRRRCLPELVDAILKERPHLSFEDFNWDTSNDQSPYKGLPEFEEQDADIFFGREVFIIELVERIVKATSQRPNTHKFLALVGSSGSGKSSIVRAGIVPTLRRETRWPIYVVTPNAHPLESLAVSLTYESESIGATTTLINELGQDSRSLHLFMRRLIVTQNKSNSVPFVENVLLVIDQFEELFTVCRDEVERQAFIDNLVTAADINTNGPTIIIIVLRADFYSDCLQYKDLHKLLEKQLRIVPAMTSDDLCAAIESPAKKFGLELDSGLVEVIIQDIGEEPGNLPLLSHALLETWKRRDGHTLTLTGYQAAGGVRKAIAHTADDVYEQLDPDEQAIARHIFLGLTELSEGAQATRRRTQLTKLLPRMSQKKEFQNVLGKLAEARLITISKDSAEVAHEALIREWPKLKVWLNEDRQIMQLLHDLSEDANDWEKNNRLDTYLYKGHQLDSTLSVFPSEQIKTRYSLILHPVKRFIYKSDGLDSERQPQSGGLDFSGGYTPLEKLFLSASLESREKIQITRSIRLLSIVLLVILLPFLVYFLGKSLSAINWYSGTWNGIEKFYGNKITTILVPNNAAEIYVGVDIIALNHSKILKSQDGGETWNDFDQGLPELPITDIIKIPDEENGIYASTLGAGVFSYDHEKSSWVPINEGLSNFAVRDIAYNLDDPSKLLLAAYGRYGGVYISDNSGATWSSSNNGLTSENILEVVIDPIAHDTVYAIAEAQGIFRSADGGETWERFNSPSENVVSLLIHPYDNSRLFIATYRNGIFRSIDSGKHWEAINSGLPNIFQSRLMTFSPTNPDRIYLGANTYGGDRLYQSKDGGENWASLPINWAGIYVRDLVENFNGDVFIGSGSGLYHLTTSQEEISSNRLPLMKSKLSGTSLAINADNSSLFMAVSGGVFRYQYDADEWEFFDNGFTHPTIRTLVADPLDQNRLYAGMFSDGASDVLFVTNNKGESWTPLGTFQNGLENDDVRSIIIDANDTKVMYAGTYGSGIFKTNDRGENWYPINAGIIKLGIIKLVINPQNSEIIYAVSEGGPVYQTTNGGKLWQEMPETKDIDVRDLKILPENSQPCLTVFGVFAGNIRCWTGMTWKFIGNGLDSSFVTRLEISESNPNTFFAGTNDKGVYWSRNNGESWEPINDRLGTTKIKYLLANPRKQDALYALGGSLGLFSFEPMYLWQRD